jgi:hypothetical protein
MRIRVPPNVPAHASIPIGALRSPRVLPRRSPALKNIAESKEISMLEANRRAIIQP